MTEGIPWRLAIDFGTSNTAAAVAQDGGGVVVLRLGARSDAIPSCVAAYNGEIVTGEAALRIAGIYPAAFEPTPKRRLAEEAVVLGSQIWDPVELVAAVLTYVFGQAKRYVGGGTPARVVLTHPEAWDEYMKRRLTAAALKAGILEESLVLMPEPVAAGWHYAATSDVDPGAHVAVLDFGGGTCDAAVLELAHTPEGPAFHVVKADGIDPLGGHDFDALLEGWVYSQLAAESKNELLEGLKSERSAADRAVLRDQIREAKHALSFHSSAPIGIHSGDHEWVCTVTRGEFEHLIEPHLRRAVELVQHVIEEALPSVQQLHRVYLTGGSSHIPALQAQLSEILPLKLGLMGDPKQVTSIGALEAPASRGDPAGTEVRQVPEPEAGTTGPGQPRESGRTGPFRLHHRLSARYQHRFSGTKGRPRTPHLPKKVLLAAGAAASAALVVAAVMLSSGGTPIPPPAVNASSFGRTEASTGKCAGKERPDLREGECYLLTSVNSLGLIAPDSCVGNNDLSGASSGLICGPSVTSNFSSIERPSVYVYGYASAQSLSSAFDDSIKRFNASPRSATKPPGWETWHLRDDQSQKVRGRVLGASENGTNYLVWTEDESLMMIRAESDAADVDKLYSWWHK
ncbi:actin-like ATPase involved in cell morphogenesis [Arthrobacter globiformis]|uniref:Hsp70 family protein n=1 Tax=Arthrobacter globiformis TaxID=1665 RepID=UPI00277E205E|nr:Hsp70 family protein [Arthrobacter globiformis]MDQ1058390.1 actin-like ATPase involved in cell morphogenesis [Arthrobacter globiformis]